MVSEPQVKTESLVQPKPQTCCQMSDSGSQSLNFDWTNLFGLGLGVDAETSLANWEHDLERFDVSDVGGNWYDSDNIWPEPICCGAASIVAHDHHGCPFAGLRAR